LEGFSGVTSITDGSPTQKPCIWAEGVRRGSLAVLEVCTLDE